MITVRQIERLFQARDYKRLMVQCAAGRVEHNPPAGGAIGHDRQVDFGDGCGSTLPAVASAVAVLRLDELNQGHAPVVRSLLAEVLRLQRPDGSWGDPVSTVLCWRALVRGGVQPARAELAIDWLASHQREDGGWASGASSRMPSDLPTTAIVLLHLASEISGHDRVRLDEARELLGRWEIDLDDPHRRLARTARLKRPAPQFRWSAVSAA
jgi:hypothetical protein